MRFGVECLLSDDSLLGRLKGAKVSLVGHPASVDQRLVHTIDRLSHHPDIQLSSAFGPQHGLRGDKQDNMVETADDYDEHLGIPIYSLYGDVRRPTSEMLQSCDVVLFDIQDFLEHDAHEPLLLERRRAEQHAGDRVRLRRVLRQALQDIMHLANL